jgi:glycosyltransferase involved in cell wall biosynthesis
MLQEAGIETHVIPERAHSFFSTVLIAYSRLKGRNIQIIHSHRYKENLLALGIGKLLGINRLVSTLHGLPEPSMGQGRAVVSSRLKARVDLFFLRHAFSRVVAVSENMKTVLLRQYEFDSNRVDLIYNGIKSYAQAFQGKSHDSTIHIGTVGRMVPIKDFNLFLDVAGELAGLTHNVRFSILGDGPMKDELLERINHLKLGQMIRLEEPCENPDSYYRSLDIYLNTSVHEGLPLSILEAMACAVPIVAPRVGGIPEIVTHGEEGFLVGNRSPKEFAKWCLKLVYAKSLRREMGERGLRKVMFSFSSEQMVRSYHRLYKSLHDGDRKFWKSRQVN